MQQSLGQLDAPLKLRFTRRDLARIKTVITRESRGRRNVAEKAEKEGVVVSNKMQKTCVVAVEWQVRHGLYGKTERRTSKFVAHDENNTAKIGDRVAIVESRPLSKRKRWVVRSSARVRSVQLPASVSGRY